MVSPRLGLPLGGKCMNTGAEFNFSYKKELLNENQDSNILRVAFTPPVCN